MIAKPVFLVDEKAEKWIAWDTRSLIENGLGAFFCYDNVVGDVEGAST